jgi:Ca-activated chloride channel family protein
MQFLAPTGFWLAALALPIILLYMLRLRRKQVQVSSTFLWEQLLREQQANAPWQRLKRNLLLLLQLLILAALIFAIVRPAIPVPAITTGSVIVLLDASASMNATDVDPSRFESARRSVNTLIDGLSPASSMTLILVGHTAEILASSETDKAALRLLLNDTQASQGRADWDGAFALAAGAARGGEATSTIVVISDGGLPQAGLPALPGDVQYLPVGESNENLAITALALRRGADGPELFAEVTNFGDTEKAVLLSFDFGGSLFDARQLTIPPRASESLTLASLQNVPGVYRAHLTSLQTNTPPDSLPMDDTAFAVYQTNTVRRVLLVSRGNLFLEQVLASLPNVQAFRALPDESGDMQIPEEPFDLYVFDGLAPQELPAGNLLFIQPTSNPLFDVGAPFEEIGHVQVNEHVLTRYVDWTNVHVLKAHTTSLPDWADALIETEQGPLVLAGETNGQRVAAITFDLRESDLPLQVTFPILFSNLINYLVPPSAFDASESLQPGDSLQILPPPTVEQIVVVSPSNETHPLAREAGSVTFDRTDEPGFYAVNFLSADTTAVEYFAVNLFDPLESDIQPREAIQIGSASVKPAVSGQAGQRELWSWLAALALIVLMIEWQVYHRRQIPLHRIFRSAKA